MIFVETPVFTEDLQQTLPDDEYGELQKALRLDPERGDLMPGSGGLRKLRWNLPNKGKRGGVRVIYYWAVARELIYMLLIYKKTQQDNLTPDELKALKGLVKREFK